MDAWVAPNRALSPKGLAILLAIMFGFNGALALVFLLIGAAPIIAFLAFDLLAVIVAFGASNRRAGWLEHIQVSAEEVRITRRGRSGQETIWTSPTWTTRVAFIDSAGGQGDLRLWSSTREIAIARALSRPERMAFGEALELAIQNATIQRRAEPHGAVSGPPEPRERSV
jgi:uncharacterized membrane protein